ncbi:hypothetical protein HYV87_02090 [Candidatus Woesearchaeota archaeon]|nr:hypothetical protein [Candidatus Woesearchaeota archaeon]
MARVEIVVSLKNEILKKFKQESKIIFRLMFSLEENHSKGKTLGSLGGILIKELKYKNFRFYFITDGFKSKYVNEQDLADLLLKFVRMSDKNHQQQTIDEIKQVLRTIGAGGFNR